jgi:hypothetical protein
MEAIDLDTPPRKKPRATDAASCYFIDTTRRFTINPHAKGLRNKIDIFIHEGGVPPNDTQPHVTLLPGGMTLSIQWKAPEKLYTRGSSPRDWRQFFFCGRPNFLKPSKKK